MQVKFISFILCYGKRSDVLMCHNGFWLVAVQTELNFETLT